MHTEQSGSLIRPPARRTARHLVLAGVVLVITSGGRLAPQAVARSAAVQNQTISVEQFLRAAAEDINGFWSKALRNYRGPQRFMGYTSAIQTACGSAIPNNAFYCGADRGIYYDARWMANFYNRIGDYSPVHILAHEFGHLIQGLSDRDEGLLGIEKELQADCLAGVFARHAEGAGQLEEGGKDRNEAIATLYEGGKSDSVWFDPQAHGTAGQRVDAFNEGYEGRSCSGAEFFKRLRIDPGTTERPRTPSSGSVRQQFPQRVGRFTLRDAQPEPSFKSLGATEAYRATYVSTDGVSAVYGVMAFPSPDHSARVAAGILENLQSKGYAVGWQEQLVSQGQRLGTMTMLQGRNEVVLWNTSQLVAYVESARQYASAFIQDLVANPGGR